MKIAEFKTLHVRSLILPGEVLLLGIGSFYSTYLISKVLMTLIMHNLRLTFLCLCLKSLKVSSHENLKWVGMALVDPPLTWSLFCNYTCFEDSWKEGSSCSWPVHLWSWFCRDNRLKKKMTICRLFNSFQVGVGVMTAGKREGRLGPCGLGKTGKEWTRYWELACLSGFKRMAHTHFLGLTVLEIGLCE